MSLIDSHCHLDDSQFNDDREAAIERALAAGLTGMLTIGTGEGPPDLEAAIRLADRYPEIYASAGIHPQYAAKAGNDDLKRLSGILRHSKCVALGEIGQDLAAVGPRQILREIADPDVGERSGHASARVVTAA